MAESMPILASAAHGHGNLLKMPVRDGLDSIVANVGPGGDCSNSVDDWPSDSASSREATELLSPVAEREMVTVPITNNIEKLPMPLSNSVPASQMNNNNNKQEIRHLPIPQAPQAPMPVNKRHVPVPQLPQAPIQVNKRPPPVTLPVRATFLHQVQPLLSGNSAPVPANKRHLQVQQAPQIPTSVNRISTYANRSTNVASVMNSTANAQAVKKTWATAASPSDSNVGQKQWSAQYHHVPLPANKRHVSAQEASKGPVSITYKRERENRNNASFGLKEPPPMHSTANKLKTNRNADRSGIEEALLGQERRPMLKNKQTNPYQFVLQDHNYGAPPPLSPPHSPANPGPPVFDVDRTPWVPGSLYRPRVEDDAASAISSERGREAEAEGEETETAPEGEGDEDAVTRCICDFQHDDGYMVRCDKCFVWQHLDCMGLDRNNPPKPDEEYLCERCQPRPVERHKARSLQMRKREEIANDSSSDSSSSAFTDDNIRHGSRPNAPGTVPKKRAQALAVGRRKSEPTNSRKVSSSAASSKQQQQQQTNRQRQQQAQAASNSKEQSALQRRSSTPGGRKNSQPVREKRTVARRKSKTVSRASDDDTSQEDWNRPVDKLRTWIDNYEEAVTNHYSPELRAKISSIKVNGVHSGVLGLHNVPNLVGKCTVRMIEPGVKVLQATTNIPSNQPVIELRGKHMLASQHKPNPAVPIANNKRTRPYVPFVFFYRLPKDKDDTEVCVDSRTYGNDARFVRRSCKPNSEVWHCMEKGMLHLYIVSTCPIDKNTEITIAHDKFAEPPAHCVCANPKECGTHPRNNNAQTPAPESKVEEAKERRKRRGRRTRSTSVGDRVVRPSREKPKERPTLRAAVKEKEPPTPASKPLKETPPPPPPPAPPTPASSKVRRTLSRERRPVRAPVPKEVPPVVSVTPTKAIKVTKEKEKEKEKEKPLSPPPAPRAPTPRPATPVEVSAPPTRRSSNPRTPAKAEPEDKKTEESEDKKGEDSKIKSREDRKIEAIMKAFERMERLEREKKRKVDNQTKRKDTPRKESTESKKEEPVPQPPPTPVPTERPKKRRRKGRGRTNSATTVLAPKRRRTRFNSGRSDSDSNDADTSVEHKMGPPFSSPSVNTAAGLLMALSQQNNGNCYPADKMSTPSPPPSGAQAQFDSGCSSSSSHSSVTPTLSSACLLVAAAVGPLAPGFKFPKTKKGLMNEWLNKSPEFPPTPSPTLTHPYTPVGTEEGFPFNKSLDTLAQAAIATSPNKENHGSAKKRWLRQVMSQEGDGSGSPNSRAGSPPCSDYVTPLKKRRVARESQSSEQSFTPPTTPTEQGSPNDGSKTNTVKNAEDDDAATSPEQQIEEDEDDANLKSSSVKKPSSRKESSRSAQASDESLGEGIPVGGLGPKSPISDSESRNETSEPRGTCEIVSVPNTPSLSRADSPQGVDSEISAAQLAQMQSDIRKQLSRGEKLDEDQPEGNVSSIQVKKEPVASDTLGETTLRESKVAGVKDSDCLETDRKLLCRTVEVKELKSEDTFNETKDTTCVNKVEASFNSSPEVNFKLEDTCKTNKDQESAKNEVKKELAKEEAKIAKRKLSISEYRQRKQLDAPANPSEQTPVSVSSPPQRARSNSSSSSTGSSSSLSDEEPPKPTLPDLPAFIPPYAEPTTTDDKKGLGEDRGNKFDHAPTLVERQRENLMQRLRREFGLFLTEETDASKQPGVVLDSVVNVDEKRRGVPPPPSPLDSSLPPRGTFPFQSKPSTNYNSTSYPVNVNYISTITGNRPNPTYPGSNRCPPVAPNLYSNFNSTNLPYPVTGNFPGAPPVTPREVHVAGGPQNVQTVPFTLIRGTKPFHTVAAAKAYYPHNNLHDRE